MIYAIVIEGHVAELIEGPRDCCVPNLNLVACTEEVAPGWTYVNGEFRPPEENGESEFVH